MAKFLLHEEPGFNMTISASEARAIQRLKETKTLGVHNWRSPNNPKGGMSFLRGNAAEDLADVKHEAVHLLQDFTGHAWGGVYSGRIPYPSAQAKLLLFDAENMAYAATSIGRSNSSLLQQTASAFGSVGYYFPGFSDYVYTLQNADEILSNVSRLPSIQGVNTNNK